MKHTIIFDELKEEEQSCKNDAIGPEVSSEEYSIVKCKGCKKEMKRVLTGYYPNGRDKIWTDAETGRKCNGHLCPVCHGKKNLKYAKIRYRRRKNELRELEKEYKEYLEQEGK